MEREFTVPIHPEDLLKHSIDQYFVAKKLDSLEPSEVETILDGMLYPSKKQKPTAHPCIESTS
jgi:hypothetical protein